MHDRTTPQRADGRVVGEARAHVQLRNLASEFGEPLVDLVLAKKREMEQYNSSGSAMVYVRRCWGGGGERWARQAQGSVRGLTCRTYLPTNLPAHPHKLRRNYIVPILFSRGREMPLDAAIRRLFFAFKVTERQPSDLSA